MEKLIKGTAAYSIFTRDRRAERLSHAYMLHFPDPTKLAEALKIFAFGFFGAEENSPLRQRIAGGSFPDCVFYPADGKKPTAEGVSEIIEDCALKPVEGDRKLYVFCGFESASTQIQNKLLKSLEEPPRGVHFLLGATSLAPVLATVKSRVKLLEIPPFSEAQIYSALLRRGENPLNELAAKSANGILGAAENMVSGGWFEEVRSAAEEIISTLDEGNIAAVAAKYGDLKYKRELLTELQRQYFLALKEGGSKLKRPAIIFALEKLNKASADLTFNAFFQGLLYDFMLCIVKENDKWLKLQV